MTALSMAFIPSRIVNSARQAQAQAFAGDIRQRATQLMGVEHEVAGKIMSETAGIVPTFPATPENHTPHIHVVDRRIPIPQGPGSSPPPVSPPLPPSPVPPGKEWRYHAVGGWRLEDGQFEIPTGRPMIVAGR